MSKIFWPSFRPAGPTFSPLAGNNQEWDQGVKKKQWAKDGHSTCRGQDERPHSGRPAPLLHPCPITTDAGINTCKPKR